MRSTVAGLKRLKEQLDCRKGKWRFSATTLELLDVTLEAVLVALKLLEFTC